MTVFGQTHGPDSCTAHTGAFQLCLPRRNLSELLSLGSVTEQYSTGREVLAGSLLSPNSLSFDEILDPSFREAVNRPKSKQSKVYVKLKCV